MSKTCRHPPDVQEHVPPPPDVQERRDEEDDAATPPVLQPAGRSQRPSPSRRRTRRSGPDPLLELLLTLTLEPFFDRNVFIFRHAATVHLFNDDRCFAMELQRLYRSLRDGTVRNHARIHPRTCTQRDTQTHARARAHTHTQVQRQSVLNSLTDALRDPTRAMCAWCVEHPHLRCTCAPARARTTTAQAP